MATHNIYSDYGKLERRIEALEKMVNDLVYQQDFWASDCDVTALNEIVMLTPECRVAYEAVMGEDDAKLMELHKQTVESEN